MVQMRGGDELSCTITIEVMNNRETIQGSTYDQADPEFRIYIEVGGQLLTGNDSRIRRSEAKSFLRAKGSLKRSYNINVVKVVHSRGSDLVSAKEVCGFILNILNSYN